MGGVSYVFFWWRLKQIANFSLQVLSLYNQVAAPIVASFCL